METIYWHDVEEANRQINALLDRNAFLEGMAKDMARRCGERRQGRCDLDCLGRVICDVSGLVTLRGVE